MNKEAKITLLAIKNNQKPEEYVFLGREKKKLADISTAFKAVCKEAKIVGFNFHDLRHDFASRLVMNKVGLYTVQELLRHKSAAMTKRYAHLSEEHKKDAVDVLCK